MIQKIHCVPCDQQSHPFITAVHKQSFTESGYVEEEYFFEGTANVYEEAGEHEKEVIHWEMPYCNRFLVRKPQDPGRFSGNIVVEILNATAGFDIDRMWIIGDKEMMRDGTIYVGITSKPDVLDSMKEADSKRYSSISWKIPYDRPEDSWQGVDQRILPRKKDCETGLFWDMLTDMARLLRVDDQIIPRGPKRWLYLAGWSQSAGYMSTYINYFAFANPNERLFDGYLAAGGVHSIIIPLNQNGYGKKASSFCSKLHYMPVPYIAVQTETENAFLGGLECRQEDSDREELHYRIYEIAGATHDTKASMIDYYKSDPDMERIGRMPGFPSLDDYPNDYPYEYQFRAVYRILFNWVRNGVLPPHAKRIEVGEDKENRTDAFGNARGGVRSPFIDVPAATYYSYCSVKHGNEEARKFRLFGHVEPFSASKLKKLYGNIANYRRLVEESAKEQTEKGFLLPEDQEECVNEAVRRAAFYGLCD